MKTITQVVQNLVKPYIDNQDQAVESNIAPVETDATSSTGSYSQGEQLILNKILYDVTAAITVGDPLEVGTNIAVAPKISAAIGGKQEQIEVSSMPTASASNVGKVLIYIGATTSTYTSGQSYQSTLEDGNYIWKPTSISSVDASDVVYDNQTSGLTATDSQAAIDELASQNQTLTNEVDVLMENGAVNLLKNYGTTKTISPVTFTVNDDKTVTASATTATSSVCNFDVTRTADGFKLKAGTYKLTGCPTGGKIPTGSNDTYAIECYNATTNSRIGWEIGNGLEFTLAEESLINITISIRNGYNLDGSKVFKPMISDASLNLSYDDYFSFAMTNSELMESVNGIKNTITGSFTVESSLTSVSVSYPGFNHNDVLGNIKGIVTINEDIASRSWITLGTLDKGPSISVQLPGIIIVADNGTIGKANNTTFSVDTQGVVKFNLREGMKNGDQFGLWATFPM